MKRILTLLLLLTSSLLYSQATLTDLNLVFDILASNNVTSSTFEVEGAVFHSTTEYSGLDVQVGDLVYFQDGPTTYSLPIQSITTQNYSYIKVVLVDESSTVSYVPTGRAAVVSVSDPNLLPIPPDGIPQDLATGILNDLRLKIQIGVNNAEEITDYIGSVDTPPAYSASLHTGETWRNSVGQLFYSNGSTWLTDKEVLLTNTSLLNQPSSIYKLGIDTSGVNDVIYVSNNNIFKKLEVGGTLTGEVITVADTTQLDTVHRVQFYQYPLQSGGERILRWNDTDGTLDLGLKGGNVTLQLGQEQVSIVKHADNSGLDNGKVVYLVGSDGQNKTVRYARANTEATSAVTFGLMTESSTGGNKAFTTTFGLVRNINTSNLTEGKVVWLSADTAGAMTAVRPIAPNHGVMIGFCVRKHATQGVIFVEIQNGYELDELHNVHVPSPSDNQALVWIAANSRWEARTIDTNPSDDITGSGVLNYLPQFNSTSSIDTTGIIWVGGRMGVGTASPNSRVTIQGQTDNSTTTSINVLNNSGSSYFQARNDGFVLFNNARTISGAMSLQSSGGSNTIGISLGIINPFTATSGDTYLISNATAYEPSSGNGTYTFMSIRPTINQTGGANGATRGIVVQPTLTSAPNWRSIEWTNSGGFGLYGIGTAPNYINGNLLLGNLINNARLRVQGPAATASTFGLIVTNSDTTTANATLVVRDDKRVGIGTNAPSDQLHTTGSVRLQNYPNTLNSTGNPVNVLSTSSTGVVESHPASDLLANTGGCAMPVNASFAGIPTGSIEITLPNLVTGYAWISFEVDVLSGTALSQKFKINIYCDLAEGGTPTLFGQSTAYVIGGLPRFTSNIRLGRAGNNIKVWIDELNTNWNSLVVKVHDVTFQKITGSNVNPSSICSGWTINMETAGFDVVTYTIPINYQPSRLSSKVDGPSNFDFLIDEKQWLGGSYLGTFTGAIQINLPDSTLVPTANNGISIHFSIYFTASSTTNIRRVDVITSYNYQSRAWESSHVTTTDGAWNNLTFRFGREGTVPVIYIGELNSSFTGFGIALRGLMTFNVKDEQHNALVQYPWSITTESVAFSNVNSTRTITATSSGAIPFTSTLGYRFNDNLFWDNTNARLGVGNTTPLARLQVSGSSALGTDRAVLVTDNATTPLNLFEIRNNGDIYFNDYPNTLNTTGNPVNVLSTGTDGLLQSHPISEVISSAGGVTGSGAAGQVTFWNGTSTVSGDNGLFWDNTNKRLGIGTTSPGSFLSIYNTAVDPTILPTVFSQTIADNGNAQLRIITSSNLPTANTYPTLNFVRSANTLASPTTPLLDMYIGGIVSNAYNGTANGGGTAGIFFIADQNISSSSAQQRISFALSEDININRVERLTIKPNGNIGLSTTSPSARLHVRGLGTTSSTTALLVQNGAATPANLLSVLDDGNVGIGTNSPAAKLEVDGNAIIGLDRSFTTGNSQYSHLNLTGNFTASTSPNNSVVGAVSSEITYSGTTAFGNSRAFNFILSNNNTSTTNNFTAGYFSSRVITAGQGSNIIGLTGDVQSSSTGAITNATAVEANMNKSGTGTITNLYGLRVRDLANTGGTLTNTYGLYIGDITTGTQTNTPYSIYAEDINALNYLAGSLGIGSTSPARSLHVQGEARISDLTTDTPTRIVGADADGDLGEITLGSGLSITSGVLNTSSTLNTGSGTAGQVTFWNGTNSITGNNNLWWNNSSARLGIGTASPNEAVDIMAGKLRLSFSTGFPDIFATFRHGGNAAGLEIFNQYSGANLNSGNINFINGIVGSTSTKMTIQHNGKIGMGTPSPRSVLHISKATGDVSIPTAGSNPEFLAVGVDNLYGTMFGTLSNGSGYIQQQRFDAAATTYNLFLQPNGGAISIGTNSNSARLHVVGSDNLNATSAILIESNNGTDLLKIQNDGVITVGNTPAATVDTDKFLVNDGGVIKTRTGAEVLSDIGGVSPSGNVATATALQTSRTLWGQAFNGTANVTGALTNVGNITATAGTYTHVSPILAAMSGEGFADMGMIGAFYDRNELTNAAYRGSVTVSITGAGIYNNSAAQNNVVVDGTGAFIAPYNLADTSIVTITCDVGALVENYSSALWQPFVQTRLNPANTETYPQSVVVQVSADNVNWYAPASGWSTTTFKSSASKGLWMGSRSGPTIPGNKWRYARFIFSNFEIGTSVNYFYIAEIGIRHFAAPTARQYLNQVGGNTMYGNQAIIGNVGIGTTTPTTKLDVIGDVEFQNPTTSYDGGILGAELLSGANATTGWTGTSFITGGFKHDSLTTPLVSTFSPANNQFYQVAITVTGRTAGSFTFTFGGYTSSALTSSFTVGPLTTSTGALTITPTADFNGTITASVKVIANGTPTFIGKNSTGSVAYEERYYGQFTNMSLGTSSGRKITTGFNNVLLGYQAGVDVTTGINNVFLGYRSGFKNTIGDNNMFIGNSAGFENLSGKDNAFIGGSAGYANTTGIYNVAIGSTSLRLNTTGSSNIAIGYSAGYSSTGGSNVFIGVSSGYNTTSNNNLIIGTSAGLNNTTGGNNVLLGTDAGRFFGTGSDNATIISNSIIIGRDARPLANNQSNQIVIGDSGRGLGANTTRIGNSSTVQTHLDGRLTVGNTLYDVNTTARIVGLNNTASTYALVVTNSTAGTNTTSAPALVVTNTQNVGIGTYSPLGRLDIVGTAAGGSLAAIKVTNLTDNAAGVSTRIELPVFNGNAGGIIEEIGNSIDGYRLNIYQGQASGTLSFGTGGNNERMRINSTGNVGIGNSAPQKTLHVTGEVRISDLDNGVATRIIGATADGDLDELTLGSGLSITSGTISVTNPISASEVFIESSTATTIDLDANTGVVKDVNGTNASFTLPTDLSRLNVYKNGIRLARTGTATTRDFSVNTGTNEITFTTALLSTDRIVIVKI